jgi:integrase
MRASPAVRAFFLVAALTGMRRSELQKLTWGQVDLAQRRITLPKSKGARLSKRGPKLETISRRGERDPGHARLAIGVDLRR